MEGLFYGDDLGENSFEDWEEEVRGESCWVGWSRCGVVAGLSRGRGGSRGGEIENGEELCECFGELRNFEGFAICLWSNYVFSRDGVVYL